MRNCMIVIIAVIAIIIEALLLWGATCGILWLICMCYGLDFSLLIATGIWLILVTLKFIS